MDDAWRSADPPARRRGAAGQPDRPPDPGQPSRELLEARYGTVSSGPFFQTRSTNDARLFRAAGIPSYGFSPFLVLSTDTMGVGGVNEGIALPAFLDGVEVYVELVRRLVDRTGRPEPCRPRPLTLLD